MDAPSDAELLAAGGWSEVPTAVVLAKSAAGDDCVAVVNTAEGDESNPYHSIVETFGRDPEGHWRSWGHFGPVGRGGGGGTFGPASYEYGYSESDSTWWVIVVDES